jgi:hypothetical protein
MSADEFKKAHPTATRTIEVMVGIITYVFFFTGFIVIITAAVKVTIMIALFTWNLV